MNIVLATDNGYIQHCAVTMTSIVCHNQNVNFYIVTESLSEENKKILGDIASKANCTLSYCYVDSSIVSQLPMPSDNTLSHISVATYYRLFLAELLPENVDKVLYLDCDIIVRGSLEPLWNTDIANFANAAVFQHDSAMTQFCLDRLRIPNRDGYFNAGMQLLNISYWRNNKIQSAFMDYLRHNRSNILFHDQDIMNAVLHGNTVKLSMHWNMFLSERPTKEISVLGNMVDLQTLQDVWDNSVIIHYTSSIKPWKFMCNHPLTHLYYEYLSKTVFKGYKPAFDKKMLWYRIKVIICKLIGRG